MTISRYVWYKMVLVDRLVLITDKEKRTPINKFNRPITGAHLIIIFILVRRLGISVDEVFNSASSSSVPNFTINIRIRVKG